MRLSTNFTLAEFTKSQTATRKGLDNTPGEEHLKNAKALFENENPIPNKRKIIIVIRFVSLFLAIIVLLI